MDWVALGAVLSALIAILVELLAVRKVWKHAENVCEQRIQALKDGLRLGRE